MKILLCHNSYLLRSGEDVALDHLRGILEARGHRLIPFLRHSRDFTGWSPARKARLPLDAFFCVSTYRRLKVLAASERPDVAVVQNVFPLLSPSVYFALRHAGVPVVQNVFNYRFICPGRYLFSRGEICERCVGGNYLHCVVRRCYHDSAALSAWYAAILGLHRVGRTFHRCVDRFIVPDRFMRGKLVEGGLPAPKMRVIANPFDVETYRPVPGHGGYALFVGRLEVEKGVRVLLAAAERAGSVPVRIVGAGPLEGEVRAAAERSGGRIAFLGPRFGDAMFAEMRQALAVVIPSLWYDNAPMVLCQSMALARAVVASDIDGIPEVITHGQDGLLFPPGDAGALAACLERLRTEAGLAERLGAAARRRAEALFNRERYYDALMAVCAELGVAGG